MLMEVAQVVAKRGTCSRLQVGAIVSRDGRIIATGYNGAPSGLPHCDHSQQVPLGYALPDPRDTLKIRSAAGQVLWVDPESGNKVSSGCEIAEHAERNAIAFAARYGLALEGGDLHVTHSPCLACSRTIINAGIKRVYFTTPYRLTDGVDMLRTAGLEVVDMSPGL